MEKCLSSFLYLVVNFILLNLISSDKKYISFLQVNSVPTKENGCEDVLIHEIAEILRNKRGK